MIRLSGKYSGLMFSLALVCTAVACEKASYPAPSPKDSIVGLEIVFCSGEESTKAGDPYMAQDGRFVCKMYYHSEAEASEDTPYNRSDTVITWFKVTGNKGNALFWNKDYSTPDSTDAYGDVSATRFYWKNRHQHAFLALADNNKLTTDTGNDGLQMCDTEAYITRSDGRYFFNTYYLLKKKNGDSYTSMADQPDPMLAFIKQVPEQSTIEANRVNLPFKHQFSIIQVNLMNSTDSSVTLLDPSSITKVELLGVSEKAYVPHQMRTNGEIYPTFAKVVDLSQFKEAELKENPYGTSISIFRSSASPAGTLTGFEGIAFGSLQAIRVTWKEETAGATVHKVIFEIPDTSLIVLEGGKKYIYNLELRRSTLILVRTQIVNWASGSTYSSEGSQI